MNYLVAAMPRCEDVNELESSRIPLLEKEGRLRDQENIAKNREATLIRADGVVRSAKSQGLKSFAELTPPVCGASEASRPFINAASTPSYSRRGMCPH